MTQEQKEWFKRDGKGGTLLHWAGDTGHLDRVPKELLTVENMLRRDNVGRSPLLLAARSGHLDQVPAEFLTMENLLLTSDVGLVVAGPDAPLFWAAHEGYLGQIPKGILTRESLMIKYGFGETLVHHAARNGKLHLVPDELLTAEAMVVVGWHGVTPLHHAAKYGQLWVMPGAVTVENMLRADENGDTPLARAEVGGYLDQILGLDLPDSTKSVVGDEWWERNQAILRARKELDTAGEDVEIELF